MASPALWPADNLFRHNISQASASVGINGRNNLGLGRQRTLVQCSMSDVNKLDESRDPDYKPDSSGLAMDLVSGAVNALFSYKPFFQFAAGRAKKMIVDRGTSIGFPWAPRLAELRRHDWETELKSAQNKDLQYPEYYLKPFHAYEKGNLSWDAAIEMDLASKSVHANVFDPERRKLDPDGDKKLRDSYHEKMCGMLNRIPASVVDIGCGIGLSTFGLHQVFPGAEVVGVDLSPYFVSVANYQRRELEKVQERNLPVHFVHSAGECTGLPGNSYDLVSLCLVCHELPRYAAKQIIEEANRLLKTGGALSLMDMNPYSASFKRMANNVFAFTAFKATEPYIDDYRTFKIEVAMQESGFTFPMQVESTPNHRTIVAYKM